MEEYDVGLAHRLAATTGDSLETWEATIAAWRYAGWPVGVLMEVVAYGELDPDLLREEAESSLGYASHAFQDALHGFVVSLLRPMTRLLERLTR